MKKIKLKPNNKEYVNPYIFIRVYFFEKNEVDIEIEINWTQQGVALSSYMCVSLINNKINEVDSDSLYIDWWCAGAGSDKNAKSISSSNDDYLEDRMSPHNLPDQIKKIINKECEKQKIEFSL